MLAPSGRRIDERGADMKKKLAALLCAAMLACALPALAWADEAAEPTADQATAQETGAATGSIGPWQESASNEDGSFVLSGETRAASFARHRYERDGRRRSGRHALVQGRCRERDQED